MGRPELIEVTDTAHHMRLDAHQVGATAGAFRLLRPIGLGGMGAVWIALPSGLLVLKGDQLLHFSASKTDLSDAAVRTRFKALAQAVIARLPWPSRRRTTLDAQNTGMRQTRRMYQRWPS